jgi:ABC-type uncharacterized transport system permease subunit
MISNFTLSVTTILFYIGAATTQLYPMTTARLAHKRLLFIAGMIAISLHGILLYGQIFISSGINFGFFNAASLVTWGIALLLLVTLLAKPVENLLIVLFPLAALMVGLEMYFPSQRILATDLNFGVQLHIFYSILAYSILSIAALQAIFLAIQDYQLHHKHPGWALQMLPPLQVMEVLLVQMIGIGVILLTASLLSGFIFLENIFAQHLVHKTVLSMVAWLIFVALLWGRWQYGWRGKTLVRWNLSGFFILMLAYFGSKLVLELILKRTI